MAVAFSQGQMENMASAAVGFLLVGGFANCHLFQNDFDPLSDSVVGDFVEATFAGYAPLAPFTTGSFFNQDGANVLATTPFVWTVAGGPTTPQLIYGYYFHVGGTFVFAEKFPGGPRAMFSAGQTLTLELLIGCGYLKE